MKNNLTSMVAFVLEHSDPNSKEYKMAKFLSQPLQLGFFVPCDLDGNVLEEPEGYLGFASCLAFEWDDLKWNGFFDDEQDYKDWKKESSTFQIAKDRVLFEGFKLIYISEIITIVENTSIESKIIFEPTASMTIEMLCYDNLTLTASALNSLKA